MNETPGLLGRSIEFLWRNPVVLLPALAARLADFAIFAGSGFAKGPALRAVAPRSVLGGFSGRTTTPLVLVAGFFTLLPLLCQVALFVYAMVVSGRWAHALREGSETPDRTWRAPAGEVARVAALTLVVGAVTAFAGLYLTLRGGVPVQWSYVVTWCFLILATWFVLPSWLRLLAREEGVRVRETSRLPPFVAVALGLACFAACVFLGGALPRSLMLSHRTHGEMEGFLVSLIAACLSALPLAFSFVAMSRYVADRPGWSTD